MTHQCPLCKAAMKERKGSRGTFFGCSRFPQCRGTRQADGKDTSRPGDEVKYNPIPILPGSDEQEAIWEYALEGRSHMVINAGPGTGKTWSMIQYCLRAPKDLKILFVAFNKHIAAEANGKLRASECYNVQASTYHSLGFRILRDNFKGLDKPDEHKMTRIFESQNPAPFTGSRSEWRKMLNLAERLSGYVKNYGVKYKDADFRAQMEKIVDHHGMEINEQFYTALSLVPPALDECIKQARTAVDFDDMIWLPVVLDLFSKETANRVICDEFQDLNAIQHDLTFRALNPSGRIMVVGDKRQAIYGFRGALAASIETMKERLAATKRGVKEFPLTITRRCPKSHVALARAISPDIRALDDAPEGDIREESWETAISDMRVGDMVICRVNQGLVKCAYQLIKRGVRPAIKGRDIGQGLISTVEHLRDKVMPVCPGTTEMERFRQALSVYRAEKMKELLPLGDKAAGRVSALADKCECLLEFASCDSVLSMITRIGSLFTDDEATFKNSVVLGTVHRTKGLEAERVYVLAPDLIPHPMAKQEWERAQETNIAWIAATRAKFDKKTGAVGELVFCGRTPQIYLRKESDGQPEGPGAAAVDAARTEDGGGEEVAVAVAEEQAPAPRRGGAKTDRRPAPQRAGGVSEIEPPF